MRDEISKQYLACAYRIIAKLGMDDLTYTHITVRSEDKKNFFIGSFNKLFSDMYVDDLIEVPLDNGCLPSKDVHYNMTGIVIHRSIYNERKDINAIIHLHTLDSVAVSCSIQELKFISQFSMPFYDNIAYHDYGSLATKEKVHGEKIALDLGSNNNMLLRNHGTISCGSTIFEAFFFARFLDQACKVQNKCDLRYCVEPDIEIIKKAKYDMLNFEKNLGYNDFMALKNSL